MAPPNPNDPLRRVSPLPSGPALVRATALDRSKVVLSNAVLVLNDQRERSKL